MPARLDFGRLAMVPLLLLAATANVLSLVHRGGSQPVVVTLGLVAALCFYSILAVQYMRRSEATSTDRRPGVWLVALLSLAAPLLVPALGRGGQIGGLAATVGSLLVLAGLAGAAWAAFSLGRNISVVPQARSLAASGPYRFLRHPLYVFEWVAAVGMCLLSGGGFLAWLLVVLMVPPLVLRARWEESLLSEQVPGYAAYKEQTRLWPRT